MEDLGIVVAAEAVEVEEDEVDVEVRIYLTLCSDISNSPQIKVGKLQRTCVDNAPTAI